MVRTGSRVRFSSTAPVVYNILVVYHVDMEITLSLIKPDAVKRNLQGKILAMMQEAGLQIIAQKMMLFTEELAQKFYAVHKDRPFFGELCESISAGPLSAQLLAAPGAILTYRTLMGATNPEQAEAGTIRKQFALSIGENSVHGSDSAESAEYEKNCLFVPNEIFVSMLVK